MHREARDIAIRRVTGVPAEVERAAPTAFAFGDGARWRIATLSAQGRRAASIVAGRLSPGLLVCGALGLLFLVAILVVDPRGEFPLNDDWSFAATTRRLSIEHDWRPLGWASMTQVTQALLGALVCAASSCSYEHLRAGTLVTGLLLLLSSYALFATCRMSRLSSAVGAIATVFNPVLYPLLYTFMTDVPFQLAIVWATLACVASFRQGRWRDILGATALIVVATLSRQLGLVLAIAYLPSFWLTSRDRGLRRAAKSATPLALCGSVLVGYEAWMRHTGRLPGLYDERYRDLAHALVTPLATLSQTFVFLIVSLLYLGLICLPVLILDSVTIPRASFGARSDFYAWALAVTAIVYMVAHGVAMPLLSNVLDKSGNGPLTLRDVYILGRPDVPELPGAFWIAVTGVGLAGLWLLVRTIIASLHETWTRVGGGRLAPSSAATVFAMLTTVLYLLPVLPGGPFDRYLAVIAPVLCLAFGGRRDQPQPRPKPDRVALACGFTAALALFSILAAHDYLAWNRARWTAIADIEATGAGDARSVDGGFEYNGDRGYRADYLAVPGKSWWWISDDALQLSFAPLPGTETVKTYPYDTLLPTGRRAIYLLRRVHSPGDVGGR